MDGLVVRGLHKNSGGLRKPAIAAATLQGPVYNLAVAAVAESLVIAIVNILSVQLHRAIAKYELRATRMS